MTNSINCNHCDFECKAYWNYCIACGNRLPNEWTSYPLTQVEISKRELEKVRLIKEARK